MYKKLILIFILFFGFINISNASLSSSFSINSSNLPDYFFKPGDTFGLNLEAFNNTGEDLKNIFFNLDLFDGLEYTGNHKTMVNSNDTNNPLSTDFYINNNLSAEITNSSYPIIGTSFATKKVRFYSINSGYGFTFNTSIGTYQNVLSYSFNAKKVSNDDVVNSDVSTKNIYVNVKPYILDLYSENDDFFINIKDYNGCDDIHTLNYQNINLDFIECNDNIFKYKLVSNNSFSGTINTQDLIITDKYGNINDFTESNFSNENISKSLDVSILGSDTSGIVLEQISGKLDFTNENIENLNNNLIYLFDFLIYIFGFFIMILGFLSGLYLYSKIYKDLFFNN